MALNFEQILQNAYNSGTGKLKVEGDGGGGGSGQTVTVGAGAVDASTTRTVAATDSPEVAALGTIGTSPPTLPGSSSGIMGLLRYLASLLPSALVGGRLDVNVGAALPAGANNIGDVDVLTMPTATVKYTSPTLGSNIASTVLNSLVDGSTSSGVDYDNSSAKDEFCDVEIVLGSFTPGSTGTLTLVVVSSADGTNFEDSAGGERYTLSVASGTSAKRIVFHRIRLYPFKCRFHVVNSSGGTLASSGNTIKVAPYNYVG